MSGIEWARVKHFSPDGFSEDPDRYADPELIYAEDQFREWLGHRVWPSPVDGALARPGSPDSQHYADPDNGILSRALDSFPEGSIQKSWLLALTCGLFGGVGIYTDTTGPDGSKWPMLHKDLRAPGVGHGQDHMLIWHRDRNGYHYPQYDSGARKRLIGLLEKL